LNRLLDVELSKKCLADQLIDDPGDFQEKNPSSGVAFGTTIKPELLKLGKEDNVC